MGFLKKQTALSPPRGPRWLLEKGYRWFSLSGSVQGLYLGLFLVTPKSLTRNSKESCLKKALMSWQRTLLVEIPLCGVLSTFTALLNWTLITGCWDSQCAILTKRKLFCTQISTERDLTYCIPNNLLVLWKMILLIFLFFFERWYGNSARCPCLNLNMVVSYTHMYKLKVCFKLVSNLIWHELRHAKLIK